LKNADLSYEAVGNGFSIAVPYFDEVIVLSLPAFAFKSSKGANVTLVTKIIILHYAITASGIPILARDESGESMAGKLPYEDIPGCRHYKPVYEKRVTKPLESAFGFDRYAFLEAGLALGGVTESLGDASFTLDAFPRVPITFVLWEGDEEFPPSVKTLFDPSIPGYLPLEDIVVISKLAATRIIKSARLKAAEAYSD
jgi:hypothetical protein